MRYETTTSAQARTNRKQRNIGNLAKGACGPCPAQDGDSRALADALLCCSLPRATCLDSDPPALQIPRYSYSFHRMVRALSLALLNSGYG
eukprot:g21086.t1